MGRLGRAVSAGVVVLVVGIATSGAGAAVLYDQTGAVGLSYSPSMGYTEPNDVETADDFTVPAGETWTITEVDVIGSKSGPKGLKPSVHVYADAGNLPGAVLIDQDNLTPLNSGPDYNSPLTNAPALGPGKYWLSVQVPAFWYWGNSKTVSGSPAVFQNPSGKFGETEVPGCGKTWTVRTTCYPATAAEPDQAFRLIGTKAETAKPSNAFTIGKLKLNRKKGTGTLTVTVPGPGTVAVSGKGLKSASVSAGAAGAVKLNLKATGKAKKKLKKKGKVKLRASITFTPTGGDPASQSKSLTLKKKLAPKR